MICARGEERADEVVPLHPSSDLVVQCLSFELLPVLFAVGEVSTRVHFPAIGGWEHTPFETISRK